MPKQTKTNEVVTPKTRKPRAKKVAAPPPAESAAAPAQPADGEMYLTHTEVLSLRLFHSEQERFSRQHTLVSIQRASYLKQVDPEGRLAKMEAELQQAAGAHQAAQKQYQEVVESAEKRLGIKLNEYTFDTDTGILRKVE